MGENPNGAHGIGRPAMRAVMTGAGGFFGSHLLARMIGAKISVTLLGPNAGESRYTASMVSAGEVRFLRLDRTFGDEVLSALDEADALIVAGLGEPCTISVGASAEDPGHMALFIVRLVGRFARAGKHIVVAGSDAVYGTPARTPVRESDATRPQTALGLLHLACERAVRSRSETGATASILRFGSIYGPGETGAHAIPNFIRAALAGHGPVLEDDEFDERDYVHVADAADAAMCALRRRSDGTYNVGTGIGTTATEIADLVVWLTDCPEPPVRRAADGHPMCGSLVLDPSRARSDLSFEPRRSFAEGLKEEVGWFKAMLGSDLKTAA